LQSAEGIKLPTNVTTPSTPSFRIEGKLRTFLDKQRLKAFINVIPVSQEMLEGLPQTK
jgi:hypothetical protein